MAEICPECGVSVALHTCGDGPEGLCEVAGLRAEIATLKRDAAEAAELLEAVIYSKVIMPPPAGVADKIEKLIARLRGNAAPSPNAEKKGEE
jgi:hypothetical protein